ncbi:hypothetical protein HALLA_21115 (plasmid) [Halostagnicola larsenii XH-48]|uniref:Uncharacterized protein n=1 Tax=Halostagnicola larsenii XH-48 TaxID=797299 RepID=W0JZN7_9EURY|nr:hypothetical protein HALLA_21115 [Halostagnicola larsenii XH-48]
MVVSSSALTRIVTREDPVATIGEQLETSRRRSKSSR